MPETDNAPQINKQPGLTGLEPQINEQKLVYVADAGSFVPLFSDWLHSKTSSNPDWFTAGKNTPRSHIANVRRGLHPFGAPLTDTEGARCGNCLFHVEQHAGNTYHKCRLIKLTAGPGTDLRVKWHGCVKWTHEDERKQCDLCGEMLKYKDGWHCPVCDVKDEQ